MNKHVPTYSRHLPPALRLAAGAALMTASAACVSGDVDTRDDFDPSWAAELGDVDRSPVTIAGDQWNSCPTWDCGKNHAMLNTFPLPELHEGGLANDDGFRIIGVERQGVPIDIEVENGVMTGTDGISTFTRHSMIGTIIKVTNDQTTWLIMIQNYTRGLEYWIGPGMISAYHLVYHQVGGSSSGWQNLCNEPLEPADALMWPDAYETYAILIDDERYDTDAITVSDASGEGWFNIACAGSALSKMMLLHFNPHLPGADPYYTYPAHRTATLKMLTADYLGIGEAFTRAGQPLLWMDVFGWTNPGGGSSAEAIWSQGGAMCLTEPRMVGEVIGNNPALTQEDVIGDITAKCAAYNDAHQGVNPPPCEMPEPCTLAHMSLPGGVWLSINP